MTFSVFDVFYFGRGGPRFGGRSIFELDFCKGRIFGVFACTSIFSGSTARFGFFAEGEGGTSEDFGRFFEFLGGGGSGLRVR